MAELSGLTGWKLLKAIRGRKDAVHNNEGVAIVSRHDADGTTYVRLPGSTFDTPVNGTSVVATEMGDEVSYTIRDGRLSITGSTSNPAVGASQVQNSIHQVETTVENIRTAYIEADAIQAREIAADKARIGDLEADNVTINGKLDAAEANITNLQATALTADSATITDLQADTAKVHNLTADQLSTATAYVGALTAEGVTAQDVIADHGDFDTVKANAAKVENLTAAELEADHAKVGRIDVDQIAADHATVGTINADYLKAADMQAEQARVGTLLAGKADVTDLTAATARIGDLEADHVSVDDFEAEQGYIDALQAATADIATIRADSAKVHSLTAAQLSAATAYIAALNSDNITAASLSADVGKIHNLTANEISAAAAYIAALNADSVTAQNIIAMNGDFATVKANAAKVANLTAAQLEADHATVGSLDANYAQVNMANVNNAWINNGVIKDGAISSAMINDVSANKLTAGTINGSVINVTNLNADNITTGTINGQRIGEGSLSLSKLEDDVYTEAEVDAKLSTMQSQIDGAIETWTGTAVPTLQNSPASSWNTTSLKDSHVGDVYFVVNSQSQQNGYNYRFTKSGSTYSWQLIKDSDVTNALQRLTTAEGKISTFDTDISQLKTDTGTLTTKTTSLETRMSDAEADILDKVDTTTFNEVSDTVDQHSQTISQHTTAISNKADSSTVTAVTNRVSKNEQDISGINTTIGELQTTVESKADGSTVSTISNKLNTVSDTVDGHTQSISSITSTQTTMQGKLDKTLVETTQLWFSKANTTAPNKPTAQVTSTSTDGNAWRVVVPAYNASYPNYYYCYQWKYSDGTYGWSSVTRDIAMGESQERARTAITNAAAADTKAGNAASAAATAVSTANTANDNASTALSTANTAASDASDAKTDAATAVSTANTASSNASTALSTANTASSNASTAVSTANTAKSTADTAKATADKNVKSTTQLWHTKANETAPAKPTSKVTSTAVSGNAWRVVVPTYASDYPYYFYCYQYELADGTFTWSDVVYDRATTENQSNSRSAVSGVSTLTTKTNNISDTVDGHTSQLSSITSTQTTIQGSAVKSTVQLWFTKANTTAPAKPTAHVTTDNPATGNAWNLAVPTYNSAYPNYYYCYEYQYLNDTYGWSAVTRDIATGEMQATARQAQDDINNLEIGGRNLARGTAFANSTDLSHWYKNQNPILSVEDGSLKIVGNQTSSTPGAYTLVSVDEGSCTVSFWYKAITSGGAILSGIGLWNGTSIVINHNCNITISDTEWHYYSHTFELTSSQASSINRLYIFLHQANHAVTDGLYINRLKLEKGNRATDWSPAPEDVDADISTAQTSANNAQATANKNVKESQQLWFTKANGSAPSKPSSKVTSTSTSGNAWTTKVPTYSSSYPYYFYCMQYIAADGTVTWSDVVYDQATTEAQSVARTTSANLSTLQSDYATFKQTTQNFESTIGTTYATKNELSSAKRVGRNLLRWTAHPRYAGDNKSKNVDSTGWYRWSSTVTVSETNFGIRLDFTANNTGLVIPFIDDDVISGQTTYTLSFDYRGNCSVDGTIVYALARSGSNFSVTTNTPLVVSETDWQHFEATFAWPTFGERKVHSLLVPYNGTNGKWLEIRYNSMQLEDGSVATIWSPAVEDENRSMRFTLLRSNWTETNWAPYSVVGHTTNWQPTSPTSSSSTYAIADCRTLNVGDTFCVTGVSTDKSITHSIICEVTAVPTAEHGSIPAKTIAINDNSTYAKAVESRVSTAETSITQNTEQIALKANASDVYTKTQTDGLISTEVSNRNSAIEQSANAINLSVSQTYTTKTEFNALEVGGRNFLKNTANPTDTNKPVPIGEGITWGGPTNVTLSFTDGVMKLTSTSTSGEHYVRLNTPSHTQRVFEGMGVDVHDHLVLSGYVRASISAADGYITVRSQPSTGSNWTNQITLKNLVTGVESTGTSTATILTGSSSEWVRFAVLIFIPESVTAVNEYFSFQQYGTFTVGDTFELKRLKLERGDKATDWTPAPEDMVTTTALESAKSEIQQTTDGITSTVSKISSVKYYTGGSSTLANIKFWAAEGYTSTWNFTGDLSNLRVGDTVYLKYGDTTRGCNVYIKGTVNSISGQSVNFTAHGYEDVLPVDTIKSTINQSADSVKIEARHVEIDGAAIFSNTAFKQAADAAYDAKGSASAVQTNLDNLEIGGRNLLLQSDYQSSLTRNGITFTNNSDGSVTANGTATALAVYCFALSKTFDAGTYTLSGCPPTGSDSAYRLDLLSVPVSSGNAAIVDYGDGVTFKTIGGTTGECRFRVASGATVSNITIYPKLEKGNRATDWTPAPEDVDADISAVEASAKAYTDAVEIGGRNLLVWSRMEGTYVDDYAKSSNGRAITLPASTSLVMKQSAELFDRISDGLVSIGDTITLSFTAVSSGTTVLCCDFYPDTYTAPFGNTNIDVTTTPKRYTITGIFANTGTPTSCLMRFWRLTTNPNYSITIWDIKWEKGTKPTDWTPAPEDVDADIESAVNASGGFDILWNRTNFSNDTNAGGECYLCAYEPTTATRTDADGWVMWNGIKRTVTKGMFNPNTIVPYNIPVYIVCRLSSASATTGTNYMVWYNSGWKYAAMAPTAVGGTWTWAEATDMVLGKFVEPGSETAFTECETYRQPLKWGTITTDTVTARSANAAAAAAQATADNAAPKASAVTRTQRIYYRKSASGAPGTPGSTSSAWVSQTGNVSNAWTTMHVPISSTEKFIYTCEQRQFGDGNIAYTSVLLDNTITVIDGGNIITGSIAANKLDVYDATIGKISTSAINLTGYAQTDDIPTKVSDLTNDTGFVTNDDIQIGGRNLLRNSYGSYAQTGYLAYNAVPTTVALNEFSAGDTLVLQMWDVVLDTNSTGIRVYWGGGSVCISTSLKPNADGYICATITLLESWLSHTHAAAKFVNIYNFNSGHSGSSLSIGKWKLERGNKPTDWSPAPEDVDADISSKADPSDIPTKVSDLTNDSGFQDSSQVETAITSKGYATQNSLNSEINQRKAQYGTCSTAAATQAKAVTCSNFELAAGKELTVKFSTANTYASGAVQLNVNSKGAKNVWVANGVTSSSNQLLWGANAYITFRYDGTQFIVIGEPRTWYGASTTAESTAAKTDTTAVTGCVICKGAKVELAMTNANTAASPTLNIQSTGAKNVYFGNGTARPTKADGTSWLATNTCTFTFDGQYWRTAGKTYIDANSIVTGYLSADRIEAGSLSANKISATSGTFDTANIPDLSAAKITSGDISADRIKANVISAINSLTAGQIDADRINASQLSIGQSQVTNLTSDLADAKKHTQVIVSATNVDYAANTCTLTARFYIDGVLQTSTSLKWQWYRDGTTQGSQTTGATGSLAVTSSLGLAHRYACKCTF